MSKSSSLVLFKQVPIHQVFTFETLANFKQFKKINDTQAVSRIYPLEWNTTPVNINAGVLVFPLLPQPIIVGE